MHIVVFLEPAAVRLAPSHVYSFALAASISGPYYALGSRDAVINSRLRFMLCNRSTASLIRQYQRITPAPN
jgi:hypothetical protein